MSNDWSVGRQAGSKSLLYESELLGTDGLARTNKPLGSASSLLSVSYVGAEASDKSKLPMVLPRDVLLLSPSGWKCWQINAMSFQTSITMLCYFIKQCLPLITLLFTYLTLILWRRISLWSSHLTTRI